MFPEPAATTNSSERCRQSASFRDGSPEKSRLWNTGKKQNREEENVMSPDKARQIGNDLACLAASIAEIAEEIKAMYDFDHDCDGDNDEAEAALEPVKAEPTPPKLEEVRAYLAELSRHGHTAAVREIIIRHGSSKLSEVAPAEYAAILAEARAIK
jgi:hypothetical protein